MGIKFSSGKTTCITISDTGCGMEQKTLERIFDKFYQGDTSHSTEGNGLGLALVKRILELSDGTIHVESTAGQGSAFMVELQTSPILSSLPPTSPVKAESAYSHVSFAMLY